MKAKLQICSLILVATVLLSCAQGPVDWAKVGPAAVVRVFARVTDSVRRHQLMVHRSEDFARSLLTGSDVIHGYDDFVHADIASNRNWEYVGHTPFSFVASQPGNQDVVAISTGTTTSVNELIGKQLCAGPSGSFPGITKCLARFVV